ncbi:MAG TPA: COX15/CtaA family protein [Phycisphaerales bacterium]|nr:COX15/CtaA family protein [Phycisphaerales bacterium]
METINQTHSTTPLPNHPFDHPGSPRPLRFGPGLVYGFASVVCMWVVWLLTHTPGLELPPIAVGSALVITLIAVTVAAGWSIAKGGAGRVAWQVGAIAGFVASAVNLLILGSYIAEQARPGSKPAEGFSGLEPSSLIYIPGFLLAGTVIGTLSGLIGSLLTKGSTPPGGRYAGHDHWLSRLALIATISILPLITLGGLVTTTASGMAVPGWPDSYGANMFLFPISLMSHPRVFLEHSHRLFGAMVGLNILALMIYTLCVEKRRWVRGWVVVVFIFVCLQGVLGGVRVNANSQLLAMVHGVSAQLFFAMTAAAAMYLTLGYRELKAASAPAQLNEEDAKIMKRRRVMATGLLHILMVQLIMGAWFRHFGQMHPLYTHIALSLVIVIMGFSTGLLFRQTADLTARAAPISRRVGMGILICLGLQFVLGWGAFAVVLLGPAKGNVPLHDDLNSTPIPSYLQSIVATGHQANGAILIGLAAAATVLGRAAARRRAA